MLIEDADYFIRVIPFPQNVKNKALILLNDDGTFSIYVDSKAPYDRRKKAMRHEYAHMANDDMYGAKDIRDIEPGLTR